MSKPWYAPGASPAAPLDVEDPSRVCAVLGCNAAVVKREGGDGGNHCAAGHIDRFARCGTCGGVLEYIQSGGHMRVVCRWCIEQWAGKYDAAHAPRSRAVTRLRCDRCARFTNHAYEAGLWSCLTCEEAATALARARERARVAVEFAKTFDGKGAPDAADREACCRAAQRYIDLEAKNPCASSEVDWFHWGFHAGARWAAAKAEHLRKMP